MRDGELGVGDTLNLSSGTDTAITDSTLNDDTYTIVGKVTTPYYLSYQYDSASVGNGKVEYLMYIPLDEFKGNLLYKDSGYNIALVQQLLQHSSAAVTQRYIGIQQQEIEKAIEGHLMLDV